MRSSASPAGISGTPEHCYGRYILFYPICILIFQNIGTSALYLRTFMPIFNKNAKNIVKTEKKD